MSRIPPIPRSIPVGTGFLAGMRIRKKLIVLHTFFSIVLVAMLTLALRPAVNRILERAELHEARLALTLANQLLRADPGAPLPEGIELFASADIATRLAGPIPVAGQRSGGTGLEVPTEVRLASGAPAVAMYAPPVGGVDTRALLVSTSRLDDARQAVVHVYAVLILALLAVYALIAVALEVFILPRHVYRPLTAILKADQAVRDNQRDAELIREQEIPADELGEIMRSHNRTVVQMRANETALADAMSQLELTLADLKKKNHLLEAAKRNLADADRLVSLGVMSAGLAHEMNTPLAVIKGLSEKLDKVGKLEPAEIALMIRVTGRLERLSESLLDFARVRPSTAKPTAALPLIEEAWTLVKLDRAIGTRIELVCSVDEKLMLNCDGDRMVQVLLNLLRNAADATLVSGPQVASGAAVVTPATSAFAAASPTRWSMDNKPRITVTATTTQRDGAPWISLSIADEGPGLDPAIASRLFEPFASTRLDSRGSGLGLAVSEGIVREHGGLILARNRGDLRGAVFEILLPQAG